MTHARFREAESAGNTGRFEGKADMHPALKKGLNSVNVKKMTKKRPS